MIQTIVSNARVPEYGQATISFPIREEDYCHDKNPEYIQQREKPW